MNKVFNKCTPKCINCQTSGCFLKQSNSVLSIVINFETEEIIYEYSSKGLPSYILDKHNGLINLMKDTISNLCKFINNNNSLLSRKKDLIRYDSDNWFMISIPANRDIHIDEIMIEFEKWFKTMHGGRFSIQEDYHTKINKKQIHPAEYIPYNVRKFYDYKNYLNTYIKYRMMLLEGIINPSDVIIN